MSKIFKGDVGKETAMTAQSKENEPTTTTTKEKSGKRKWLSRFGTFLMMGGWLLILVVVLGIVIAVSILAK